MFNFNPKLKVILSLSLFVFILGFLLSGGCGKVVTVPTTSISSTTTTASGSTTTTILSGWNPQNSGTGNNLNAVYFINETTGWIGGDGGVVK